MGVAETEISAGGVEVAVEGADEDEVRSLTDDEREQFLEYVAAHTECSVREACEHAGIRRKDVRSLLKRDQEFLEDYRTARGYGAHQIFGQMVKLAIEGVEEPIASGGAIVGHKRVFSERLLQTMFNGLTDEGKAMAAGKLGLEITGADGGPIKIQPGVSLGAVAEVLAAAGVDLASLAEGARTRAALEAGEPAAEIVGETDEPA